MTKPTSRMICISEETQLSKSNHSDKYLILESNFHEGYYTNLPFEKNTPQEHHFFMLSKSKTFCFQDKIVRMVSSYEKQNNAKIHIYPGTVKTLMGSYNFIRFRAIELDAVMVLVQLLADNDIKFIKNKKFEKQTVVVQFKQPVILEEIQKEIFRDTNAPNVYYLPLKIDVDFENFKKLIIHVRNNCDYKHFECALAYSLNENNSITDFAKIYSPNCEQERLKEFCSNFDKAAHHYNLI